MLPSSLQLLNLLRFAKISSHAVRYPGFPVDSSAFLLPPFYRGRVLVGNFDPQAQTLFIQIGKSKDGDKPRHVTLAPEAVDWCRQLVKVRGTDELMFRRTDVVRTTREDLLKGFDGWASYDQIHAMELAVKRAKISEVSFHELSHTYASGLLNAGVPLSFVAEQLGHADLRMVTRHNGHIAREAMHNAIRKAAPTFGIAGATRGEK